MEKHSCCRFRVSRLSAPLRLLLLPRPLRGRMFRLHLRQLFERPRCLRICVAQRALRPAEFAFEFRSILKRFRFCRRLCSFKFCATEFCGSSNSVQPFILCCKRFKSFLEVRNRRILLLPCFRLRQVPHLTECV